MKLFHISDVLSVTTGRLVSNRHVKGLYDILNFMTNDNLFTHQLPRAADECLPWLDELYPELSMHNEEMEKWVANLDVRMKGTGDPSDIVDQWVEDVREAFHLNEYLTIREISKSMHARKNPIQELEDMVGKEKVITVAVG
jgi:hypothetical protein